MSTANYRSLPIIEIDGQVASTNFMEDLLQVTVEESLHFPAMFTLMMKNDYQSGIRSDRPWEHKDLLQIGKPIRIGFTSSTIESFDFSELQQGLLIVGEITAIETHFTDKTKAPIIIRGYDASHRLHRGRHNRSFQNMTDKDIVKKIASENGIELGTIEDSGAPHEYLFQENQTNMEFLRERAARIGFELFVQDGKLHFRQPKATNELDLVWLKDIDTFRVRVTSAEQVQSVEVRAWDYSEKQAIVSTAAVDQVITATENGRGSQTSSQFNGKPIQPKMIVVDRPVAHAKEADAIAQAVCNELGGQFVQADAKGEGSPALRPGKVVKLAGLGPHSGRYYITETRHSYSQRIYLTEFGVRGLRSNHLLTTLAPAPQLQPGQTLLVGIVTDNDDPEGWGRVKVKFPTLTDDHASTWARVVAAGAGTNRGFDCLPEIDDEVLVGFEHGDIHRPYVIGGVWNGKDQPPEPVAETVQQGKVRLRTFKTRSGHQIQFVEEEQRRSKAGIRLETSGGHKIYLNDSDQSIAIQTTGGHRLQLDDRTGTISLEGTAAVNLTAAGAITLSASTIRLNAGLITSSVPIVVGI
ncbi:VgrG-related protein [Thermocoleostomius sinensis]|uniref:VgrG-related protein n=1 Tax=Thermocoleostomius sinensis A174 TaxID=2016057 RepID=A0A9E8ZC27_9CYAN|nr:VgrG-related protein [Thermocoleostomius sinensis]WAL60097.1 VgrG-related protein [Thermocoleostomius sinensis A174]